MSDTLDFTVEFELAAFRLKYAERRRHVFVPIRLLSDDTWLLAPTVIVWWQGRDDRREPVTIMERNLVVARVLATACERHHLRIHTAGELAPPPTDETGAPLVENLSPPDGEDTLRIDPELERLLEADPMPDATRLNVTGSAGDALLAQISAALARVQPMADAGWDPAQSIARQLQWCGGALRGAIVETPPGPFSMGLIATREFDMYGNDPELASLINEIQRAMHDHLRR